MRMQEKGKSALLQHRNEILLWDLCSLLISLPGSTALKGKIKVVNGGLFPFSFFMFNYFNNNLMLHYVYSCPRRWDIRCCIGFTHCVRPDNASWIKRGFRHSLACWLPDDIGFAFVRCPFVSGWARGMLRCNVPTKTWKAAPSRSNIMLPESPPHEKPRRSRPNVVQPTKSS